MKNLVIALAHGCCDWHSLEPFATSIQRNIQNTDLVLFVGNISKFAVDKLKTLGIKGDIELIPVPKQFTENFGNMRWTMYKNFLSVENNYDKYDRIFCPGARDVIFQDDIFKRYDKMKNFFLYGTHFYKISDEPSNTQWIKNIVGETEYQKIKDNWVACADTIFGSSNSIKKFLEHMSQIIGSSARVGDDQAALNYIVHSKFLPVENLIESNVHNGDVLNIDWAINPHSYAKYPVADIIEDKIRNLDGGVPAVVHQWPCYQSTIQLVDKIYRERDFTPNEKFIDTNSAIDQVLCLVYRQNYNVATKFFINYVIYSDDLKSYGEKLLKLYQLILQRYNPDAEILLSAMQKAFVNVFSTNLNLQQMEDIYRLFVVTDKNIHVVNSAFKNFVKSMLVAFTDMFYKQNQPNYAMEYIKRLTEWRN